MLDSIVVCRAKMLLTNHMWHAVGYIKLQSEQTYGIRTTDNIYIYENPAFNLLVWGSLRLAPINKTSGKNLMRPYTASKEAFCYFGESYLLYKRSILMAVMLRHKRMSTTLEEAFCYFGK